MCDKDNDKKMITVNSTCSTISLSGLNSVDFLNNLLISNLTELEHKTFHYTALCNPKGRIISSMWINICSADSVILICPKNLCADLLSFFNMRKFRLKIDIKLTDDSVEIKTEENKIQLSSIKSQETNNTQQFYAFMFAQNLPWIDARNSEKFIPQHVNLDQHKNTMSFSKGCYPGQEIIARIKYLGKIKKRMYLLGNINEQALLIESENYQAVSPIIHNFTNNLYNIQVIRSGI